MINAAAATTSRSPRARALPQVVLGVMCAPVTLLLSGAVTAVYFTDGLNWVGLLLSMVLVAAAVLLATYWPTFGVIAGSVLALFMGLFAITGTSPGSRPELDFNGVIVFGGAGILSAALVATYITAGIATLVRDRRATA